MDELFDASPVAMVVVDGDGRIRVANQAARELFGRDDLVGMDIASLRDGDVVRRPDGKTRDVETRTRAVTHDGRAADLVALHDVSHRRAVEAATRESLKMQALGRFAGSVVHDLNNLLSVILSYSDFLVADLGPGHASFGDAEEVKRSGQRAAELLRRLMAFSRPSGVSVVPTDVHALLDGLRAKVAEHAGPNVKVELRCVATQPRALIDAPSMETAVVAIVDNAREAMPNGGTLSIETLDAVVDEREAELHNGARPGPHLVLRFVDDGVGMDERVRERALEPFFTTKQRGKGIGLGLPLVYGFATACGGHVRIDSAPGRGATIALYLVALRA